MEILDWLNGFEPNQLRDLKINGYPYEDFLLGSGETQRIRDRRYHHIPIPNHFLHVYNLLVFLASRVQIYSIETNICAEL